MAAENVAGSDVKTVKRWLEKLPRGTASVVLLVKDGDAFTELQVWEASDAVPALAQQIIDAVVNYAEASEGDAFAHVRWLSEKGKLLQTRVLRQKYEAPVSEEKLSGSLAAQAAQAQRFAEKSMQMMSVMVQGVTRQMFDMTSSAIGLAQSMAEGRHVAEAEVQRLRDELHEVVVTTAEDAVEQAREDAEKSKGSETSPIEQIATAAIPFLPRLIGGAATKVEAPKVEAPKEGG